MFRKLQGTAREELLLTYQQFDRDDNGTISENELRETMTKMGVAPSNEQLAAVMQDADDDENGLVSFEDFYTFLVGNCGCD